MPRLKERITDLARTKDGKIVFGETPNLPVIVAVGASLLAIFIFIVPLLGLIFALIAFGAWFTWAWLELFDGTNTLRRILGCLVMALLLAVAYFAVLLGAR